MIPAIMIALPGEPVGKARPRFGNGRVYTPSATRAYEHALKTRAKLAMKQAQLEPFEGPVAVKIEATFQYPASWSKREREAHFHTGKPDADNISKIVGDALNKIVVKDDAQIAVMTVRKRMTEHAPGIIVDVMSLERERPPPARRGSRDQVGTQRKPDPNEPKAGPREEDQEKPRVVR